MEKTYNLVELFSGIGSQAKALKNLGINVNLQGTCEWDVHAIAAYDVIHNDPKIPEDIQGMDKEALLDILQNYSFSNSGKSPLEFSSLRTYSVESLRRIYTSIRRNKNFVDVTHLDGTKLSNGIDILTYSFPCQDLSNVGAFHGYIKGIDKDSGSRSSLLWQVGRILTEMKGAHKKLPRFLLLENVPTLLSERHFSNFKTWIADLEKLGYISHYYQLNATSFGLPQNRPRLLMISVYVGEDVGKWNLVNDYFAKKKNSEHIVADYRETDFFKQYTIKDFLRLNYSNKKIMSEAIECTPNDTVSRQKIWRDNPQIIREDGTLDPNLDAVRTITTKQDRNPNSGNLYFDSGIEGRSKFRYLTPRECLLFMGFTDEDFKCLKFNNVEFHKGDAFFARDKVIRMAGNSIPVKLLEGVFYQILQIDQLLSDDSLNKLQTSPIPSEDYSNLIRSYAFKKGIRSRINQGDVYPKNATVVYPKYKTAIYIHACPFGSQVNDAIHCTLCNHAYWSERVNRTTEASLQLYTDALNLGWSVIIVKPCEFKESCREETLNWIVLRIKEGLSEGNHGRVYKTTDMNGYCIR